MTKAGRGRPSIYTDELAAEICKRIAEGQSLRAIEAADDMPSMVTIMSWVNDKPDFFKQYTQAKQIQAELLADEMINIADEESKLDVQRAKLMVDTRKWAASKLLPKRYGDKQAIEHSGPDGGAIVTSIEIVAGGKGEG